MIGKVIFFFCTSVEQLKTIDIHLMIKNSKRYLTASICKRENNKSWRCCLISKNINVVLLLTTIRLLYHSSWWGVWLNIDNSHWRRRRSLSMPLHWHEYMCVWHTQYARCSKEERDNIVKGLHACWCIGVNTHMLNLIRYTVVHFDVWKMGHCDFVGH